MANLQFNDIDKVAQKANISTDLLEKIYYLESEFHHKITVENNFERRQDLYNEFYKEYYKLPFPSLDKKQFFDFEVKAKTEITQLFKKELTNKSILDVGCGSGCFLYAVAQNNITNGFLMGIDAKKPEIETNKISSKIIYEEKNCVKFELNQQFDIVISDNVYEHITTFDTESYLKSMRNALHQNGKLILIIPHKNFGPWDYTKIKDTSNTGKIQAECAHVNETTFKTIIGELKNIGFTKFTSPLPFIALSPIRKLLPNWRINANFFAMLENNVIFNKYLKKIKVNNRPLFRMEVIVIAQK